MKKTIYKSIDICYLIYDARWGTNEMCVRPWILVLSQTWKISSNNIVIIRIIIVSFFKGGS